MAAKKASAEKAADTVVTEEVEVTGSDSDSDSGSFSDSDSVSDSDSESESEGGDAPPRTTSLRMTPSTSIDTQIRNL